MPRSRVQMFPWRWAGASHLQLQQELCGGARGGPSDEAILGVQVGVELRQGLADRVCLFLKLR